MWSGTEQQRFAAVIRAFESETGVVVRYVPAGHDISDVLAERQPRTACPTSRSYRNRDCCANTHATAWLCPLTQAPSAR